MAEFKISRIRYTWQGAWTTGTAYIKDDVVKYGGSSWICIRQHTASTFNTDQTYLANILDTDPSPAWIMMSEGYAWRGNWSPSTEYTAGDLILNGGVIYLCVENHTAASTFNPNFSKWTIYTSLYNWTQDWNTSTLYFIGDIVKNNGIVYRCVVEHTSSGASGALEDDQSSWAIIYSGSEYIGEWTTGEWYHVGDLVKYGGTILRCNTGHESMGHLTQDGEKWSTEFLGFGFYNEWDISTPYAIGDVVRHGGFIYRSNVNHVAQSPGNSIDQPTTVYWTVISKATRLRGVWSSTQSYKTGDLVRRGGYLYVAKLDSQGDGSSLDYLDTSNWEIVVPGDDWRGPWQEDTRYSLGDLVVFAGTTWRCNIEHFSDTQNFPSPDNGSGFFYWDIVLLSGDQVGMQNRGDMLTYDLSRKFAQDGSTFGPTNVGIGTEDDLLAVGANDDVTYKTWGNINQVINVAPHGVDDEFDADRGINYFKPYKTIRFACERVFKLREEGILLETDPVKIRVWTGRYEEVLPIIVPKLVAVQGDEVRSATVVAKGPNPLLDEDAPYTIFALDRISQIIENIVAGTEITKNAGNTEEQVILTETVVVNVPFVPPQYDLFNNEIYQSSSIQTLPIATNHQAAVDIQDLIQVAIQYIRFHLLSLGNDPTMVGTNTPVTSTGYTNAVQVVKANRVFIAAEVAASVAQTYQLYEFDRAQCERDVRAWLDAFLYDIIYTGNYKTILAARYYRNAVLGSEGEDMFYLHDATGVRNMTLTGLVGTLNPPGVNEIYRRPTGGAYCSLDPGWGADDSRTWIMTRSPYIQNCATFGYGVVGQKVDGSLHNGGNKSFVSNDFTQLISDGIGAWILNGGRAELVSVFTYYSTIGMFAEDGGIIRATNGNSSYGNFGAIADGNDPTETPRYGFVNNRLNEAFVSSAFAGEVNDEILIFEFGHAGEQYSSASYSIVGAGTGASVVQEEFRDNAMFQALVRNAPGDSGGTPGAGGYVNIGNNAQAGDSTSIRIASNDTNTEADLLGLRIIITSGDGTGQYGYVGALNELTKQVSVYRESDDQPGWDHVLPGKPIVGTITTNATYRFEPRPIFSPPPYSAMDVDLVAGTIWANIVYGETTETYQDVVGTVGTGTTDGIVPITATWTVVKNGRSYYVTIANSGAGYADEQTITIDGADVGGISGENDVVIVVKSVSDDSTNSILTFEYIGVGASGRFVAAAATGNTTSYSMNGTDWETGTLPYVTGDWRALAAGNNRFVAIGYNSDRAALSFDGINWTGKSMPSSKNWNSVCFGSGIFVAVAGNADAGAFSTDGSTWTATTLPDIGDSTFNEWVDIAYGNGKFVAIANSGNFAAIGTYNSGTGTISWTAQIMDVIADSSVKDWVSIAYGNNRFVAVSGTGEVGYSFDGLTWYPGTMPTQDGSTVMHWRRVRYGQGVFLALCDTGGAIVGGDVTDGTTNFIATSYDGVLWTGRELSSLSTWNAVAFGNPDITLGDSTSGTNSSPMWVITSDDTSQYGCLVKTGARTLGRCIVDGGNISEVRIWEPGSGYITAPTLTIVDPGNSRDAYVDLRMGDGVLAQPSWTNRGSRYKTSSTQVTISGNGYADIIPYDKYVGVSGLVVLPGPGAQFRFRGENTLYTVVTIAYDSTQVDGTFTGVFQVSPALTLDYDLLNNAQVEIRERYSQVRITGHDFLDVGTGNFDQSNYPELYSANSYTAAPENEVVELNGGRVFYTSTDQSGNFRTGELFSVEQATGIVTISADFFDLNGLTELALGGVRLGGSGAVVREFSTDPLFTADSNNVVPTQRAIKSYLQTRLNVGGAELQTASFVAGTVKVGPGEISNVAGLEVLIPVIADFSGAGAEISGSILAQDMFFKSFKDRM